jgi:hypothetical protein
VDWSHIDQDRKEGITLVQLVAFILAFNEGLSSMEIIRLLARISCDTRSCKALSSDKKSEEHKMIEYNHDRGSSKSLTYRDKTIRLSLLSSSQTVGIQTITGTIKRVEVWRLLGCFAVWLL